MTVDDCLRNGKIYHYIICEYKGGYKMQGDEIMQAAQIEIEGVKFFLKGSMQVISWLAQSLKAIFNVAKDKIDHRAGERSLSQIFKLSEPDMPQKIDVEEKYQEEFFSLVKAKGLQYCKMVDFDLTDGKIPIMVPGNQMSAYATLLDSFLKRKISEEEAALKKVQNDIDELKEKLISSDKKEIPLLETTLENKTQAKNELMVLHEESLKQYEDKCYAVPVEGYLSEAKGTEFERDPDKAIAEYNQGVPMVRSQSAKECMQPIRSPYLIPISQKQIYVPESGVTIERTYHEEDGIAYSNYLLKTEQGEIHEFSDKGVTKEKWNSEILPKIFDIAGIVEGIKCKIFETMEQVKSYFKHFDKTTPISETKNVDFSNAEVVSEAELAVEDALRGMASAKVNEDKIEFQVPQEKIFSLDGKLTYAPDGLDGELYMFGNIEPGEAKDGMISFKSAKNEQVTVKGKNVPEKNVSANAVKDVISDMRRKTIENVRNSSNSHGR